MQTPTTEPAAIVIFGASGDLTGRKLIPALHSLNCEGLLHKDSRLIGIARTQLTDDGFREQLYDGILEYSRFKPNKDNICSLWPDFAGKITYICGQYSDPALYRKLSERLSTLASTPIGGNCLFYLATPPNVFPVIVQELGRAGLNRAENGWRRIIIEKPFGRDLESARRLTEQIRSCFVENQVFRIHHYLGKKRFRMS